MPKTYNYAEINLDESTVEKVDYLSKRFKIPSRLKLIQFLVNREYAKYENIVTLLAKQFPYDNPQTKDLANDPEKVAQALKQLSDKEELQ